MTTGRKQNDLNLGWERRCLFMAFGFRNPSEQVKSFFSAITCLKAPLAVLELLKKNSKEKGVKVKVISIVKKK